MFVNVELPEGASLERTEQVMNQVEDILKSTPGVAHTINRIGSSIITQATASNSGTVICIFEPFEERKKDSGEVASRHPGGDRAEVCARSARRACWLFQLPSVRGLSTTGGVKLMVQDRGGGTPDALEKALQGPIAKASSRPELARMFTLFRASTPQIFADINRIQAKSKGVDVTRDLGSASILSRVHLRQ